MTEVDIRRPVRARASSNDDIFSGELFFGAILQLQADSVRVNKRGLPNENIDTIAHVKIGVQLNLLGNYAGGGLQNTGKSDSTAIANFAKQAVAFELNNLFYNVA